MKALSINWQIDPKMNNVSSLFKFTTINISKLNF